jgi:hypothetical protein|tara:strand:- start:216 stop:1355 length:1140 start_codon:yes stop_codon:yes gene_type:complete
MTTLFQRILESRRVAQDNDIEDKEGSQPKKYHSGLDKKTKQKRDAHFKAKKTGPAPGDKDAKTKKSVHTKKFEKQFNEEQITGLKNKAEKSGISYGILKKVYDRGMAAYKTGHRPGTTAQQWAFARVNSFITKGSGTWGKADKDLATKVRGESMNESLLQEKGKFTNTWNAVKGLKGVSNQEKDFISNMDPSSLGKIVKALAPMFTEETEIQEACWAGYKQVGTKQKGGKTVPNCVPMSAEELEIEENTKIKMAFSKIKGLTKDQLKVLASIPTASLQVIAQQISGLVMGEDRDYKSEYENYHKDPKQIKRRAARNSARKSLEDNKNLTKDKDVHHKDNNPENNDKSNLSIVSQNYNRKEPRLRERLVKQGILKNGKRK